MRGRICLLMVAGLMAVSATAVGAPAVGDEVTSPAPTSVVETSAPETPEHEPEPVPQPAPAPAPEPEPQAESTPAEDSAPTATAADGTAQAVPASTRSAVVAAAIAGLSFSPTDPLPGGAITVTGTGCDPGEDVLIRTFSTMHGVDTYINVVAPAAADGSFSIPTRVWGAPGDPTGAAGGETIGVAAYCGGVETTDPDRRQVVFGTMATPVDGPVPPVAAPDSAHTPFGTPVTIDVLANDTGDGIHVIAGTNGANGDVVWAPDGSSMTYTPHAGFVGTDTFGYSIRDSALLQTVSTVTVTVAPPAPPVAVDDEYATALNTPLHVPLTDGLLANDSDPEGDAMRVCLATSTHPSHGTLTYPSNDGRFDYTPDPGFTGVDSFTYHAGDRTDCGNYATVSITVVAPTAPADTEDSEAGGTDGASDPKSPDDGRALPDTGAPAGAGILAILGAVLVTAGVWLLRRGRQELG